MLDTRPGKDSHVDAATLHAEWREQAWQLGTTPDEIVDDAVGQIRPRTMIDRDGTRTALIRRAALNSTSTDALAARARINEPNRQHRREHVLRQWRGSPGPSEPHCAAAPMNIDSTREILRKWKVAPGTDSPTTPPTGNDDLRQLLDEQRRTVERSSPHLDLGL